MTDRDRKVPDPRSPTPPESPAPDQSSPALEQAERRHRALLSRADRAIHEAMSHADEMFGRNPTTRHR